MSTHDYEIFEATTDRAGLSIALQHQPDLILLDINLPDIDGTEVVQRLRADPVVAHIKVIAVTANSMQGDREHFLSAGCDGYIAKPVSRNELINTITHFLKTPV